MWTGRFWINSTLFRQFLELSRARRKLIKVAKYQFQFLNHRFREAPLPKPSFEVKPLKKSCK